MIVDEESGAVLGTSERERAFSTIHEGAVYLHLGDQYGVTSLDLESRAALVRTVAVDWYTQARKETETSIVYPLRTASVAGVELHVGLLSVREQVVALPAKGDRRRERDRHDSARAPRDVVRDGGRVVLPRRPLCSPASTRCRRSSPRCTPPSTR